MQKISGLVIDPGDDYNGAVLRSIYPDRANVSNLVKQADARGVDHQYRAGLPDSLFALVLRDGDVTLRKFACIDAGNTALNVGYFLQTAAVLPEEAQVKTAQNLCVACDWYGIKPPEGLEKIALGLGHLAVAGLNLPSVVDRGKEVKQNMRVARASGGVVNPSLVSGKPPAME